MRYLSSISLAVVVLMALACTAAPKPPPIPIFTEQEVIREVQERLRSGYCFLDTGVLDTWDADRWVATYLGTIPYGHGKSFSGQDGVEIQTEQHRWEVKTGPFGLHGGSTDIYFTWSVGQTNRDSRDWFRPSKKDFPDSARYASITKTRPKWLTAERAKLCLFAMSGD